MTGLSPHAGVLWLFLVIAILLGVVVGAEAGAPGNAEERFDDVQENLTFGDLDPTLRSQTNSMIPFILWPSEMAALLTAGAVWAVQKPPVAFVVGVATGASALWIARDLRGEEVAES